MGEISKKVQERMLKWLWMRREEHFVGWRVVEREYKGEGGEEDLREGGWKCDG